MDLDEHAKGAYARVRRRLAERQGVDVDDKGARDTARHLVLGYPSDTTGDMPVACELAARGLDFDHDRARAASVTAAARSWTLLAQVTVDAARGSARPRRLFFWIPSADLSQGVFDRVWAFARHL